jgi:hypothetical protein
MTEPDPTSLRGRDLAAVLIVIATCISLIEWKALSCGVDGTVLSLVLASLVAIAAFAVGRIMPK